MIIFSEAFNQDIFSKINEIWNLTGVGNAARGDNFISIQNTLKNGGKMLTLYEEEKLIGTCWLTHDFRRSYIHHMALHPEYQKKGYGKLLLEKALEYSKELGFQAKLEVHNNNPHAQKLYREFGFKLLDGYEVYIKREI